MHVHTFAGQTHSSFSLSKGFFVLLVNSHINSSQVHVIRSNKQTCISESLLEGRGQTRLAINERNQGVEQVTQLVI